MKIDEFTKLIELTAPSDVVYVCFVEIESAQISFYVGCSTSIMPRIGDYYRAAFAATADFRVGEAIKYFCQQGHKVVLAYRESGERLAEERRLISEGGASLLNSITAYNYKTDDRDEQLARVHRFCDELLERAKLARAPRLREAV